MSSENPHNIITQVTRKDSGQSALIQAQYNNERKRGGLLRWLCCCCYKQEPSRSDEYRKDLNLEPIAEGALLPPPSGESVGKRTLVLDLDETLLHSSFKPIPNPDFIIPVEIEDQIHKVYVLKRPGVDRFLESIAHMFEVVVFTASISKYADPVLDLLDIHKVIKYRLFREACSSYKGNYVKDLNKLGRDLKWTVIVDNSPTSYLFHPENAIPVETWLDDETDTELDDLLPILKEMSKVDNVRTFLDNHKKDGKMLYR